MVGLVTGGASGLGRATAQRLLKEGGKVVVVDLPTSEGEQIAQEMGDNAIFAPADVSNGSKLLLTREYVRLDQ